MPYEIYQQASYKFDLWLTMHAIVNIFNGPFPYDTNNIF